MKRCSTSTFISYAQIKVTVKYHVTPMRIATIQKARNNRRQLLPSQRNPLSHLPDESEDVVVDFFSTEGIIYWLPDDTVFCKTKGRLNCGDIVQNWWTAKIKDGLVLWTLSVERWIQYLKLSRQVLSEKDEICVSIWEICVIFFSFFFFMGKKRIV